MTVSTAKAQIFSAGVLRNQNLKGGGLSTQGIELSSTHFFISGNAGLAWGKNDQQATISKYVGIDVTPTGFHHAYLANNFAPFVGVQYTAIKSELVVRTNSERPTVVTVRQDQLLGNLGFKYSKNRLIASGAYQFGKGSSALVVKVAYVFSVSHDCLRKRMIGQDWSF